MEPHTDGLQASPRTRGVRDSGRDEGVRVTIIKASDLYSAGPGARARHAPCANRRTPTGPRSRGGRRFLLRRWLPTSRMRCAAIGSLSRYGAEFVAEAFRKAGVVYKPAEKRGWRFSRAERLAGSFGRDASGGGKREMHGTSDRVRNVVMGARSVVDAVAPAARDTSLESRCVAYASSRGRAGPQSRAPTPLV